MFRDALRTESTNLTTATGPPRTAWVAHTAAFAVCGSCAVTAFAGIARRTADLKDGGPRYVYGNTWKCTLLTSLGPCLVTVTKPLVAPAGTLVWISEFETTVKAAFV